MSNIGNKELLYVIESTAREKGISVDSVVKAVEEGLKLSARREFGKELLITCHIDRKTGKISIYNELEIVSDKLEKEPDFNPKKQITLKNAKLFVKNDPERYSIDSELKVGNFIKRALPNIDTNRVTVQIVGTEIKKKIREAEIDKEYNEFIGRVGTIVNGVVKKIGIKNIIVDLDGYEALLSTSAMLPGERFRVNDRIRAYIKDVKKDQKGGQIMLSRADDMFLAELFRQEVPEIYDGIIEIRGIARDPGSKAKLAVFSRNENSDIIGACVGIRGTRVQAVTNELKGEKIDVIKYSEDPIQYIINAISPAKPIKVIYSEEDSTADVVLNKDQLSLAIGRSGQNVRLASKITGIKIEVMTEEQEKEKREKETTELINTLMNALDIEDIIARVLIAEGYDSVESIANVDIERLKNIEAFKESPDVALELQERAIEYLSTKNEQ